METNITAQILRHIMHQNVNLVTNYTTVSKEHMTLRDTRIEQIMRLYRALSQITDDDVKNTITMYFNLLHYQLKNMNTHGWETPTTASFLKIIKTDVAPTEYIDIPTLLIHRRFNKLEKALAEVILCDCARKSIPDTTKNIIITYCSEQAFYEDDDKTLTIQSYNKVTKHTLSLLKQFLSTSLSADGIALYKLLPNY